MKLKLGSPVVNANIVSNVHITSKVPLLPSIIFRMAEYANNKDNRTPLSFKMLSFAYYVSSLVLGLTYFGNLNLG